MNSKVRRSSLKFYLNKPMHPNAKASIEKKFKVLLSFPSEVDTDPPDYYRYHGQQVLRLMLLEELNTFIMEHACSYTCLRPWAKELWELREHCQTLLKTSEEMLRALIHHGNHTGIYKPDCSEGCKHANPDKTSIAVCGLECTEPPVTKMVLSANESSWLIGDGCLIQNDTLGTEAEVTAIVNSYIGTEVTVDKDGNVFSHDGVDLGTYYT